jgi:hypothetical protein
MITKRDLKWYSINYKLERIVNCRHLIVLQLAYSTIKSEKKDLLEINLNFLNVDCWGMEKSNQIYSIFIFARTEDCCLPDTQFILFSFIIGSHITLSRIDPATVQC